jgi:hypothetical protein
MYSLSSIEMFWKRMPTLCARVLHLTIRGSVPAVRFFRDVIRKLQAKGRRRKTNQRREIRQMTAIKLPGQLELPTVIDHAIGIVEINRDEGDIWLAREIAKSLRDYEIRPSSETWRRIQQLAAEILK